MHTSDKKPFEKGVAELHVDSMRDCGVSRRPQTGQELGGAASNKEQVSLVEMVCVPTSK